MRSEKLFLILLKIKKFNLSLIAGIVGLCLKVWEEEQLDCLLFKIIKFLYWLHYSAAAADQCFCHISDVRAAQKQTEGVERMNWLKGWWRETTFRRDTLQKKKILLAIFV